MNDISFKQHAIQEFALTMLALVQKHEHVRTDLLRIDGTRQVDDGYETTYIVSDAVADILQAPHGTRLTVDRQFLGPGEHICDVYTDAVASIFNADRIEIVSALTQLKRVAGTH